MVDIDAATRGRQILEVREAMGYTVDAVCSALELPRSRLAKIESGRCAPSFRERIAIGRVLHWDWEEFIGATRHALPARVLVLLRQNDQLVPGDRAAIADFVHRSRGSSSRSCTSSGTLSWTRTS